MSEQRSPIDVKVRPVAPRANVGQQRSHVVDTAAVLCLALVACVALVMRESALAAVALTSILPVVGLRTKAEGAEPQPPRSGGGSGAAAMLVAFAAGLATLAAIARGRA